VNFISTVNSINLYLIWRMEH